MTKMLDNGYFLFNYNKEEIEIGKKEYFKLI